MSRKHLGSSRSDQAQDSEMCRSQKYKVPLATSISQAEYRIKKHTFAHVIPVACLQRDVIYRVASLLDSSKDECSTRMCVYVCVCVCMCVCVCVCV